MERSERSLLDRFCSSSRPTRRGDGLTLLAIRVGRPALGQVPRLIAMMMMVSHLKLVVDVDEDSTM